MYWVHGGQIVPCRLHGLCDFSESNTCIDLPHLSFHAIQDPFKRGWTSVWSGIHMFRAVAHHPWALHAFVHTMHNAFSVASVCRRMPPRWSGLLQQWHADTLLPWFHWHACMTDCHGFMINFVFRTALQDACVHVRRWHLHACIHLCLIFLFHTLFVFLQSVGCICMQKWNSSFQGHLCINTKRTNQTTPLDQSRFPQLFQLSQSGQFSFWPLLVCIVSSLLFALHSTFVHQAS